MSDYLLNEIDLDGYQVVRSQYFQKQAEPILTLCSNAIAFGQGAYQAFNNCEAVHILLSDKTKSILVRPASTSSTDAVVWRRSKAEPKYCKLDCPQLARKIYDQWGLDKNLRYKAFGRLVQAEQKILLLFDFNEAEIYDGAKKVDKHE